MENNSGITRSWSKRKRRLVKASVVAASLLVALLIAEVALRIAGYTYPLFYTTDRERGYALRAGMKGWYRKEGESFVQINSQGLRDREHAKEKPPDTIRIAVLGDSYAEALQVNVEDAFWKVLERRLAECKAFAGKDVEVINFGVSGYGTAQELITLRRHVWQYAPDIVMLTVTTNNDITDNSRALKKTDEIPYFIFRDNQLVLDNSFLLSSAFRLRDSMLNRTGRLLRDNSRVIQAFHQTHVAIKTFLAMRHAAAAKETAKQKQNSSLLATQPPTQSAAGDNTANLQEVGIDNMIYRAPEDDTWMDAWHMTEELIVKMRDEVRNHDAAFLVVTLSNGIQVYPDPASRAAFMRRVGATDLFYPDHRVKALGERAGFPVINLAPALQNYAEEHNTLLHGFGRDVGNGHWNAAGHRVAGNLIAEKFCGKALQITSEQ